MTRPLTHEEEVRRAKRLAQLPALLEERFDVMADFADRLELQQPAMIVAEPWRYLSAVSEYMRDQDITDAEDRVWITTRVGYFLGELLVEKLKGHWFLNEIPDSRYFLEFVVGRFRLARNPNAMVAPFAVADHFARLPVGRVLSQIVAQVVDEIEAA